MHMLRAGVQYTPLSRGAGARCCKSAALQPISPRVCVAGLALGGPEQSLLVGSRLVKFPAAGCFGGFFLGQRRDGVCVVGARRRT